MMRLTYERCAALDVGEESVVACPRWTSQGGVSDAIRTFQITAPGLLEMTDWLCAWEVSVVAFAQQEPHWKMILDLLGGVFDVRVIDGFQKAPEAERPSGISKAEWLAERLSYGLPQASLVTATPRVDLRDLTWYRTNLIQERAEVVDSVYELLEYSGVRWDAVVRVSGSTDSVLTGDGGDETGNGLDGLMVKPVQGKLYRQTAVLEKALAGMAQGQHRFILGQRLAHIDFLNEQIEQVGEEIARRLGGMDAPSENSVEVGGPLEIPEEPIPRRQFSWSHVSLY